MFLCSFGKDKSLVGLYTPTGLFEDTDSLGWDLKWAPWKESNGTLLSLLLEPTYLLSKHFRKQTLYCLYNKKVSFGK